MLIIISLIAFVLAALWAVMTRSLLRSAIALALTSAMLTIVMFRLRAAMAAAFELSVCAGLISVVFISALSLTHPLTWNEIRQHMKDRLSRFWYLPVIVVVVGFALFFLKVTPEFKLPPAEIEKDVREVLWNLRQLDLIGQVAVLLAGGLGVVILFRDKEKK
ncbi:MAG: hypothetical protein KJ880_03250 [Candidatus Omnitrophica bacterium]|nr:hypothetical protein [Candidatus Omnitrophota bacterium]MBU1868990.1 hypothetical protein [Candidatus Omnitrophota bacterium]